MRGAALREAQDSEDRTRPYVGMDIVPGLAGSPTFDIVIENLVTPQLETCVLTWSAIPSAHNPREMRGDAAT